MSVTALTPTAISRSGIAPTLAAANADGSTMVNTGKEFLLVTNAGASPRTVSAAITKLVDGVTPAAKVLTVPAGASRLFGPFPRDEYNNASDPGAVAFTYDAVTDLTVGAFRLTNV
jgi:hypothetical protein